MLDELGPFALKEKFDLLNLLREQLGDLRQDLRFLSSLRRGFLPLPTDRPVQPPRFPPLEVRPHAVLAGKRVGLVTSGGSGALVSLCGVKRAFEEAGVELAAISVCSGSAIWGAMIAAGLSAEQMVDACFGWKPGDLLDLDVAGLLTLLPRRGRGFAGLLRGEAVERTMGRLYGELTLADTPIPCYSNVYNLDTNELGYLGRHNHPELRLARLVRIAIALPLFVQPVPLNDHLYADGGTVDIFPVEPLLRYEQPFDHIIGVNVIMPPGFRGEDITGWTDRTLAIIHASRQLYHVQWLELARQQMARAGDRFLLLEPIPYSEIAGTRFFDVFLEHRRWPELVERAYLYTREWLSTIKAAT
jgi:NTE family protein